MENIFSQISLRESKEIGFEFLRSQLWIVENPSGYLPNFRIKNNFN